MRFNPEIFGSVIVAVGSFNPAIFSPDWLLSRKLIGSGDCDAAQQAGSLIVTSQVSAFETDWFHLQVVDNQFSLTSKGALTPAIRDLAQGIFETVPHTPVTAVGLNFLGHFKMATEEDYHLVGDTLAPKAVWREIYDQNTFDVGLADMQVFVYRAKRGQSPDSPDRVTIQLQPSSKIKVGIYLSSNDHRAKFASEPANANAASAALIVQNYWEASLSEAERVFDGLLSNATAKGPM